MSTLSYRARDVRIDIAGERYSEFVTEFEFVRFELRCAAGLCVVPYFICIVHK